MKKKIIAVILTATILAALAACGTDGSDMSSETKSDNSSDDSDTVMSDVSTGLPEIDYAAWKYNSDDNVYYQIGISYCENPADEDYETLAVFVPGEYLSGTDNGDGTFTCEINSDGSVGSYTAANAPIVMPINTPGYSAQSALTDYTSVTEYTSQGFVYVHAGCRGRDAGAPAGVTDLKAAVKYLRYTDAVLPGDAESIFTFGMSGGGAQSALMGSTGDSSLYDAYLEQIGAVSGVSDAVLGSMCWCPITNLDSADEAYEWMMGPTRNGLSDEEQEISDRLAAAFADYINNAGFKDSEGHILTLDVSSDGIYQAGSYYDYMKSVIENSLNNFLSDTEFPYDASSSGSRGGGRLGGGNGGPGGGHGRPSFGDGEMPGGDGMPSFGDGEMPGGDGAPSFGNGKMPGGDGMPSFGDGEMPDGDGAPSFGDGGMPGGFDALASEQSFEDMDDITRNETTSGVSISGTYETAQDYMDALNENGEWVSYNSDTNTATITSIRAFVNAFKAASKNLGAFDQLDAGQGENTLFGYGDGNGEHFDAILAGILSDLENSYASGYEADLQKTDAVGNTVDVRLDMYTPLYYLLESEEGYQSSTVAKYWRIRTGIAQGDCALSTEMNLALALEQYSTVKTVDFETIWGAGHTQAERIGNSTDNFIEWVNECMSGQ